MEDFRILSHPQPSIKMEIQNNVPIKAYTTFGFDVKAGRYVAFYEADQLKEIISTHDGPFFILGGGSNMCLTGDISSLVLHNKISGIEIVDENDTHVWIQSGAGVNWHDLVLWTLERELGGLENLSLIPGTVGAAPIQNIGAYGIELQEVFDSLQAMNLETREIELFDRVACDFGYRDSYFKREGKGRYIILSVRLKLQKAPHTLHLEYGAIQQVLLERQIDHPGIKDVSDAVISIRQSKLPDPSVIGNAGSFFKNPVVDEAHFLRLKDQFPNLVYFVQDDGQYKIPAGWLIDQRGWKGRRLGHVGVHKDQALVLVHYGGGSGKEILQLSKEIRQDVFNTYGIELQEEVNII